jgi:plasmid stabilization system protein ParE
MTYSFKVLSTAEIHIDEAVCWYYLQADGLESKFLDAVKEIFGKILDNPLIYPHVNHKYRRALIRNFPYIVYFSIDKSTIKISAVFHTRRSPEATYKHLH